MTAEPSFVVVVDVGNTNAVVGVFLGDRLQDRFRISTDRDKTADEYGALFVQLFERAGLDPAAASGVIVSSVVPPLNQTFQQLSKQYFGREALFVEPGHTTGLPIRYDIPSEVGADRIVNAVAAERLYGAPVIVVDFGTATTFDVVNAEGEYAGGIIAPGLGISAEALFSNASRLYRIDIKKPGRLVGRNTGGAMQSGLYYGYIGLVDGILERLIEQLGPQQTVVATGGQAELIAGGSKFIREVNGDLTLIGLKRLYELNS